MLTETPTSAAIAGHAAAASAAAKSSRFMSSAPSVDAAIVNHMCGVPDGRRAVGAPNGRRPPPDAASGRVEAQQPRRVVLQDQRLDLVAEPGVVEVLHPAVG